MIRLTSTPRRPGRVLSSDGKLLFQAGYGHLFTGAYIAENLGTSADQDWAYAQLWVNF